MTKKDNGKTRYDLLDPSFLEGVARVMTQGAEKYGSRDWENGMTFGRVFAALMRHSWAWWAGEDTDPESGLPHVHHMGACIMMLARYATDEDYDEFDDRPNWAYDQGEDDV